MDIGFYKYLSNGTEDILSRNLVQGGTKVVRSKISLFSYLCYYYINIDTFAKLFAHYISKDILIRQSAFDETCSGDQT